MGSTGGATGSFTATSYCEERQIEPRQARRQDRGARCAPHRRGRAIMKWMLVGVLAAGAVACASSGEIRSGGYAHLQRAQYYQSQGNYYAAEREREAANKQFAKANRRAYEETYGPVYW